MEGRLVLEIERLNQFYGESHTLWDVDLELERGTCTCLMGRNGVGKTTLLKSLMGTVAVRSGRIRFDGAELTGRPPWERARRGIGLVPQGRDIFALLTVQENLRVGLASANPAHERVALDRVFSFFPILREFLSRRGGDLSGGQQQQLAIGRALMAEPKLLILDEPTEGIQPNVVREIGDVLLRLNREAGVTVLLVEQKLPFARRVAQRFCILDRGRVVENGRMDALTDDVIRRHLVV
jgi:urea transport system ATP-binding protein